jgi:hypothetical protein
MMLIPNINTSKCQKFLDVHRQCVVNVKSYQLLISS